MNCKQCQMLVDSYVEAELDQRVAAEVSAHVAVCASCGAMYEAVVREGTILRQYLKEIDPSPNLWARVDEDIAQTYSIPNEVPINGWFPALLKSAPPRVAFALLSAVALILVTINALRQTNTPPRDPEHVVSNAAQPESRRPNESTVEISSRGNKQSRVDTAIQRRPALDAKPKLRDSANDAIRAAEQQYSAAITLLSRDFVQHRKQLNPTAVEQLEQTLANLDATIAATRRAAYADPKDPVVVQYLMTAYARKVDALRQLLAV